MQFSDQLGRHRRVTKKPTFRCKQSVAIWATIAHNLSELTVINSSPKLPKPTVFRFEKTVKQVKSSIPVAPSAVETAENGRRDIEKFIAEHFEVPFQVSTRQDPGGRSYDIALPEDGDCTDLERTVRLQFGASLPEIPLKFSNLSAEALTKLRILPKSTESEPAPFPIQVPQYRERSFGHRVQDWMKRFFLGQ